MNSSLLEYIISTLILVILGTELTHGLGGAPHLALAQGSELLLKTNTVHERS
jgi:hypothetical protein